jgi:hypothetical protein
VCSEKPAVAKLGSNEVSEILWPVRNRALVPPLGKFGLKVIGKLRELPSSPAPVLGGEVSMSLVVVEKLDVETRNSFFRCFLFTSHLLGE